MITDSQCKHHLEDYKLSLTYIWGDNVEELQIMLIELLLVA